MCVGEFGPLVPPQPGRAASAQTWPEGGALPSSALQSGALGLWPERAGLLQADSMDEMLGGGCCHSPQGDGNCPGKSPSLLSWVGLRLCLAELSPRVGCSPAFSSRLGWQGRSGVQFVRVGLTAASCRLAGTVPVGTGKPAFLPSLAKWGLQPQPSPRAGHSPVSDAHKGALDL